MSEESVKARVVVLLRLKEGVGWSGDRTCGGTDVHEPSGV